MRRVAAQIVEFPRYVAFVFRVCGVGVGMRMLAVTVAALPRIVRTRTLRSVDAEMSRLCPPVRLRDGWTRWQRVDFGIFRDIMFRRVYEPDAAFVPRSGDTVVDLGANDGVFSVLTAKAIGHGRVIAVEAQADECALIARHAQMNSVAAIVTPVHGFVGAGGVLARADSESVPALDLDVLFELMQIEHVALMKIDIEGSEFALFEAPGAWLASVDRIAMEAHPPHGDVASLCLRLRRAGFSVWTANSSTPAAMYVYADRRGLAPPAAKDTEVAA